MTDVVQPGDGPAVHWANDKADHTRCGIEYSLFPSRTRDIGAITCPECKRRAGATLNEVLEALRRA